MQSKNMKIIFFYALSLFCVIFIAINGKLAASDHAPVEITLQENRELSAPPPLISPYPVLKSLPQAEYTTSQSNCPQTPKAIHDLIFVSIYTDKSQGVSIVDKKAQKKYRAQTRQIKRYEQKIEKWLSSITEGQEDAPNSLRCMIQWLYDWAREDSLLKGEANFQGEANRKWALATIASSYGQIKNIKNINREKIKTIDAWLKRLGQQVIRDYNVNPESKSRNNNHMFWSAWAVLITGIAIDDRDFYNWSMKHFKRAMHHMNKDGTLPLELFREKKAFNYHMFAGGPLVMMAEAFTVNGDNMYHYNNDAMHRFVALIITELQNGQALITDKTGKKQDLKGTITVGQLAWLEVYNARFPNKDIEAYMKDFRPAKQRRLGGNLTDAFRSEK